MTVLPKGKKTVPKERQVQPGPSRSPPRDRLSPTPRRLKKNGTDPSTCAPPSKKGHRSRSQSPGVNSDDERVPGFKDEQLEADFKEHLRSEKGWHIKEMQGDGACLFRAVADQVYGDEEMHGEVRRLCLDYMERNRDHFSQFITEDFDAYVTRKRLAATHGNHVEIQAISEMYARPVEIYEYNTQPKNSFHPTATGEMNAPLRLSYHGAVHYNSVVDPNVATIGVGLGLPGHAPGAADSQLLNEAIMQSEMVHLEDAMLQDKLHMSDWQRTEEELKNQVVQESYLEYVRTCEGSGKKVTNPEDEPCGSKSCVPSVTEEQPCSSGSQQEAKKTGLYEEMLLMGAVEWGEDDDSAMVAQALLMSQQEFMDDLQKRSAEDKKKQT